VPPELLDTQHLHLLQHAPGLATGSGATLASTGWATMLKTTSVATSHRTIRTQLFRIELIT
jgi:hypothetical protein